MDHSEFKAYTLEDLYEALDSVDDVAYPGQRSLIEKRINELEGNADQDPLCGLGGWLILVGIGVIISPIWLMRILISTYKPLFEDGVWVALTTEGSETYTPYLGSLLVGEIIFNTIIIIASIYLIYLFFSKHHFFPKLYIALVVAPLIFVLLDAWLVTKIFPGEPMFDAQTAQEFGRGLIAGMVWVPYMLFSKRVRLTFIEKLPAKNTKSSLESALLNKNK